MSLYIVSTPIGHPKDLSFQAQEVLSQADVFIVEDLKSARRFLKLQKISFQGKPIELLNEHSTLEDVDNLLQQCQHQKVALISDEGTPCFCDPGVGLVALCRKKKVKVYTVPGASCLMCFLAGCGVSLKQFFFQGFLPRQTQERKKRLEELSKLSHPVLIMDTPYRLVKTLKEVSCLWGFCVLGLDLTTENEEYFYGHPQDIEQKITLSQNVKRKFMLLLRHQ